MGLEKAKSLLPVKEGKAFLDLIAEQIKHTRKTFDSNVKFVLMNSFSTSDDTKASKIRNLPLSSQFPLYKTEPHLAPLVAWSY